MPVDRGRHGHGRRVGAPRGSRSAGARSCQRVTSRMRDRTIMAMSRKKVQCDCEREGHRGPFCRLPTLTSIDGHPEPAVGEP